MKTKKILLISALVVIASLNLIGCSSEKANLNKNSIITDDVKSDTEPNLKVISSETMYLDEPLSRLKYIFTKKNDGSMMINNISGKVTWSEINIKNNKITLDILDLEGYEGVKFNRKFHSKKIENGKTLIKDYYSDNQFEINEATISNDDSIYSIKGNFLIEYSNINKSFNHRADNIIWTNLKEDNIGNIQVPKDISATYDCVVVGNRLFVSATSNKEVGLMPDTLLVIDLTNNKIENKIQIGGFTNFEIIDEDRVLFNLDNQDKSSIEIYNINNKTRKEFIKYGKIDNTYENSIYGMSIGIFPSKDRMYYSERDGSKIYVKVAEINGMDIENVLTVYEQDVSDTDDIGAGYIVAGERYIDIYNQNNKINSIDKITDVKLNK